MELSSSLCHLWTFHTCHKAEVCVCLSVCLYVCVGVCAFKVCSFTERRETDSGGSFSAACTGWWMRLLAWFALWNLPSREPRIHWSGTSASPFLFWASVSRHDHRCVEYICHTGAGCWHFPLKPQSVFSLLLGENKNHSFSNYMA